MVTELGRQPWIIYHLMRTKDAVTSMPNVTITFFAMTALYVILGIIVVWLLSRHVIAVPDSKSNLSVRGFWYERRCRSCRCHARRARDLFAAWRS